MVAPIPFCTKQAVAGKRMSGVDVQTIIRSNSFGDIFADSRATLAASIARVDEDSFSPAMRLSRIPVRVRIHSSEVSRVFSRSSLVRTFSGRNMPVPAISALILLSGFISFYKIVLDGIIFIEGIPYLESGY